MPTFDVRGEVEPWASASSTRERLLSNPDGTKNDLPASLLQERQIEPRLVASTKTGTGPKSNTWHHGKPEEKAVMITQKTRKHTAWLLIGALAIFSLAAIACSTDPVQSSSTNEESPNIGAPAGVVDGAGPSSVSDGGIVASGYDAPAIEPVSSYGAPTLYGSQTSAVNTANSGIWVTGQATLEIPANIAQVSIGVESREVNVADARQKAAEAMDNVLAAITELGIDGDDVVTSYFNIQPQTIWVEVSDSLGRHSEPRITGYIVNNTVQVTVRDIDVLGTVIDTAAATGGDLIRINSIQFTVGDSSVYGEQIRQLAAADALAKADLYARVMGVTLGPLVYLTELGSSVPMAKASPVAMEVAAMDIGFARTPISAGDVNLSVTVQVVFAIVG
ncbi:MAG TPA: DUF541 domain-containing protein [Dehalococcoidia bacterium]|nr:DUF541 domain-containing protein [Dehalococcoidia bacterium]